MKRVTKTLFSLCLCCCVLQTACSRQPADDEIPYPVYPNGSRYHVGGENGLSIVLYQTHDSFEEVDQFYKSRSLDTGMPRLAGMDDYVRYAISEDDQDPWETAKPGIVIHHFNDDDERAAVGADESALTNIIMSF